MDTFIDGQIHRQMDGYIDRWMDTQIDGWIHRQMDGYIDRWIDEWIDKRCFLNFIKLISFIYIYKYVFF